MNKFVKGAKNLALALSFVSVCACGGVKKSDLNALEENLKKSLSGIGEVKSKVDTVVEKVGGRAAGNNNENVSVVEKLENIENDVVKIEGVIKNQFEGSKKNNFIIALGRDFSGLEKIVGLAGSEKLLDGFVFNGEISWDSDAFKIVGKVDKNGFFKEFTSTKRGLLSDKFFVDFVKCGGEIVLKNLDGFKLENGTSNKVKFDGGSGCLDKEGTLSFLIFLKECGIFNLAKSLDFKDAFKTKQFSFTSNDWSNADSIKLIKAVCDEGSFDEKKMVKKNGSLLTATFKIRGVAYDWDIASA